MHNLRMIDVGSGVGVHNLRMIDAGSGGDVHNLRMIDGVGGAGTGQRVSTSAPDARSPQSTARTSRSAR